MPGETNFKAIGVGTPLGRCKLCFWLLAGTGPGYDVRSPEGSASSVCGDSQRDQLADDDTCLPATPRDDRSELSFYRRLIEGSGEPAATTARSAGIVHQHASEDTSGHSRLDRAKRDGDKSRSPGYRAYTIEEYRTLPIPKLDRSLGPDKVEMQAKVGSTHAPFFFRCPSDPWRCA